MAVWGPPKQSQAVRRDGQVRFHRDKCPGADLTDDLGHLTLETKQSTRHGSVLKVTSSKDCWKTKFSIKSL